MPKWKKPEPMPDYIPTKNETEWHKYCVDHGIIISPMAIKNEKNKWHIGIAMRNTYKKVHLAPYEYDRDTVWISYYEMCKYYYDKRRR